MVKNQTNTKTSCGTKTIDNEMDIILHKLELTPISSPSATEGYFLFINKADGKLTIRVNGTDTAQH